jgi:hypothetical protein
MATRKILVMLLLAAIALGSSGCIVPIPYLRKSWEPIDGLVLDKATGNPVADAEVVATYDTGSPVTVRSGADGRFHFGAKYYLLPGILIGPSDDGLWNRVALRVNAAGYLELQVWMGRYTSGQPQATIEDGLLTLRLARSCSTPPEQTPPESSLLPERGDNG